MTTKTRNPVDILAPVFLNVAADALSRRLKGAGVSDEQRAKIVNDAMADTKEAMARNEDVKDAANAEPWYKSRVTVGALVSGAAGLAAVFGVTVGEAGQENLTTLVIAAAPIVGSLVTLVGRWRAKATTVSR